MKARELAKDRVLVTAGHRVQEHKRALVAMRHEKVGGYLVGVLKF